MSEEVVLDTTDSSPTIAYSEEIWENRYINLTWPIINPELKTMLDTIEFLRLYAFHDGEYGHTSWTVFCIEKNIKPRFTSADGQIYYTGSIKLRVVS